MKKIVTVVTYAFTVVVMARRALCVFCLVAVALGTGGCSTAMPLSRNSQSINTPMGIMVIETASNLRGPICGHLKPYVVKIHGTTPDGGQLDYNVDSMLYPSFENLVVTNETLIQLVSIPLTASTWTLKDVFGYGVYYEQVGKSHSPKTTCLGNFKWVFNKQVGPLPSRGVLYLGHIKLSQRLRASETEARAGGRTPMLDQKMSRFHESTFDVEILDCQDADLRIFRQQYPVLGNVQVEKALLH
jgi:hypothetical protein